MIIQDEKKPDYSFVFAITPESESAHFKLHKHELRPCIPSLSFYYLLNGKTYKVDVGKHYKYSLVIESEDAEAYYGRIDVEGFICLASDASYPIDKHAELKWFFSIDAFIGDSGEVFEEEGQEFPPARLFLSRIPVKRFNEILEEATSNYDDGLPF